MKKFFFVLSYVLGCLMAIVISLTSCNEEDFEALMAPPEAKDYKSFADKGLGFAYEGMTLDGDTVVFLGAKLKETTIPVAPDSLLKVSLLQDLPIQKNETTGIITANQTFISDDGQETYVSLRAEAPEHLLEFMKLKSGYRDYYFDWSEPTPIAIGDIAQITEHIKPMLIDSEGQTIGNIPALEPWYYHTTTVKPDDPVDPEPLTIKVDTAYFWSKGKAYLKINAVYSDGTVAIDSVMPIAFYGGYYGTALYNAVAPARLDETKGNNGKLDTVEPQPDRSYSNKVVKKNSLITITASQDYYCFRVKRFIKGDSEGELKTHAVVDYWTMSYTFTFHDEKTLTTWPLTITNNIVRDEFEPQPELVGGKVADDYGREHNYLNTYWVGIRADLSINGGTYPFDEVGDGNIICSW